MPRPATDEVARAIIEELRAHQKPYPTTIYLVDLSPEMVQAFEENLQSTMQGN